MSRSLLVDAPSLPVYDLGAGHPFARDRQLPLFDLLDAHGLVAGGERFRPPSAGLDELLTAHTEGYLTAIQGLSASPPDPALRARAVEFGMDNGDNPVMPGQHRAAAAVAGATLHAVGEVVAGHARRAHNTAGGLHHAMPDHASGFCIYNDLVVGIRAARRLGVERVLYVDFDVHHGDGVEFAFRDDPTVLTVSFHQDPGTIWPGTGRADERGTGEGEGHAVNVPLAPGTGDASWLRCVEEVLPTLVRAFRPGLIVSQHGCDPHWTDPLANLELTTRAMVAAAGLTDRLTTEVCDGRWVATGGGGYQPYTVIPRVWSAVWCTVAGKPVPDRVDEAWRERWAAQAGGTMPEHLLDEERTLPHHQDAARRNERTVAEVLDGLGWL